VIILVVCLLLLKEPRLLVAVNGISGGDAARESGKVAEAIASYRAALDAQPGDPQLLHRLINATLRIDRPDMALTYLRQLVSLQGWSPESNRQMADILTAQGDSQQALVYLRASLTGAPADIPTLRQLIAAATNAQDWQTVADLVKKLMGQSPTVEEGAYQLGLMLAPTDAQAALVELEYAAHDPNIARWR